MPVNLASFRAYMLNQWSTFSDERIRDDEWQQCFDIYQKNKELLSEEKLRTYPCVMSGDLSRTTDWTAIGMVFYIAKIDKYYFTHRFFIPYGKLEEKLVLEGEQLKGWIDEGASYCEPRRSARRDDQHGGGWSRMHEVAPGISGAARVRDRPGARRGSQELPAGT